MSRLWGMLYPHDAALGSRMTVIVATCCAFGPTVSEAKSDILPLQNKGGVKVMFTINAVGQVYINDRVSVLGEGISAD